MARNALDSIKASGTRILTDTADFHDIKRFGPSEGTTNPSLLLAAAQSPAYTHLFERAKEYMRNSTEPLSVRLTRATEHVAVDFGSEIWRLTGRVSTEIDVTLSFDIGASVAAALRVIRLYEANGVPSTGVRIKIAATWEGVRAAQILESQHGISVLVTVVFGLAQAQLAAEAGVSAVAPYVGRIGDWYTAQGYVGPDMGVRRVQAMQTLFRERGYKTEIMAASFRNIDQCQQLAGIHMLTISPAILLKLQAVTPALEPAPVHDLSANGASADAVIDVSTESAFRWAYNSDACAVEKSAQALRQFADDTHKLKEMLVAMS